MKKKKLWIFVFVFLILFLLNGRYGWTSHLADVKEFLFLKEMIKEHFLLACCIYILLTVVGSVFLALPGVTFAIVAGMVFGPVTGTICCLIAATLGAIIAFLAGRFFLKDSVKPLIIKQPQLNKWIFESSEKKQIVVLMITRLVPIFPYNLQNFAYGITDMKFTTYVIGSFLFMLPGTAMYTVGSSAIFEKEGRGLYLIIAICLAICVIGIGIYLKKRYIEE